MGLEDKKKGNISSKSEGVTASALLWKIPLVAVYRMTWGTVRSSAIVQEERTASWTKWCQGALWGMWTVRGERRSLDNLGRHDMEIRRRKLRYCQHKDHELSWECIEDEASVKHPNWNFSRELVMQVYLQKKKEQEEDPEGNMNSRGMKV